MSQKISCIKVKVRQIRLDYSTFEMVAKVGFLAVLRNHSIRTGLPALLHYRSENAKTAAE